MAPSVLGSQSLLSKGIGKSRCAHGDIYELRLSNLSKSWPVATYREYL